MNPAALDRRSFLRLSLFTGGGLVLGVSLRRSARAGEAEVARVTGVTDANFAPNVYVRIAPDGTVTIFSARPEIGQGIRTSLPMVVAEELEVDFHTVKVVDAPLDPAYGNQTAGGSNSTPQSYLPLRRAGATARVLLLTAAAQTWGVPVTECFARSGAIHHRDSGRSLTYGELVAKAATLPLPDPATVPLKDPKDFKLLGSRVAQVNSLQIVTGQPLFGIDQKVPGMLYAVYTRCPVFGGKVVGANLAAIKALPGVKDAFIVSRTFEGVTALVPGVAIVADSTWSAFSARQQLDVTWDEGPHAGDSWASFVQQAQRAAQSGALKRVRQEGDPDAALAGAAKVVEASYRFPFVSHLTLEPQNCTVTIEGDQVKVLAPTQSADEVRRVVSAYLGLPPANVTVTVTRNGGGFGRRAQGDYALEAAAIAQKVGAPIKLTWTREDDLQHDHFRAAGFDFFKAGLDAQGRLTVLTQQHVGFDPHWCPGPNDYPSNFVPHYRFNLGQLANNIPMGQWRAPRSNTSAWVVCTFLDEVAHAAGRDPVAFNLELLGHKDLVYSPSGKGQPYNAARMREVVRVVAEQSGWGEKLPPGRGRGLGYFYSHLGYVAEVAEVTISKAGDLTVDRVVAAVDVGSQILNLSGAENQIQGSIIDGLGTAWHGELNIEKGRITQSNLQDYPMIRMPEAPRKIEIHYVKTDYPPTGLGEPALPPLAPAVGNAIFAAIGKRIRELPFAKTDLSWS